MDYQIASKKLIFTIVIFSLIYITTILLYRNIIVGQTVSLCSNGQQIVAVFHLEGDTTVLIPTSSLKDTLDCLRRGMSFYDRTIEYVITSRTSDTLLNELHARYTVDYEQDVLDGDFQMPVYLTEHLLRIDTSSFSSIFLKNISNPFTFVDYIRNENPKIVIVPELSEVIARLIKQNSIPDTSRIVELQEGGYITFQL